MVTGDRRMHEESDHELFSTVTTLHSLTLAFAFITFDFAHHGPRASLLVLGVAYSQQSALDL